MKKTIVNTLFLFSIVTTISQAQVKIKNGYFGVIANVCNDSIKGPQIAALLNSTDKHVTGTQISGLFNYAGSLSGAQVGGLFNISDGVTTGSQIAGIFNATDSMKGMQISGLFNYNPSTITGAQIAGLFNESKNITGVQIAGLFNNADTISGVQISGLVNRAKQVNGLQIGVINISDSCNGVPLGFFSYSKHGYHKIEFAYNESRLFTAGLRSGAEKFHNIFFVGADAANKATMFTYGYGIGSSFYLSKRWNFGIDLTSQQIQPVELNRVYMHLLNKAQLNVEFKAFKKMWLSVGPSFNILVADLKSPYYKQVANFFRPAALYESRSAYSQVNTRLWFGTSVSIKIF